KVIARSQAFERDGVEPRGREKDDRQEDERTVAHDSRASLHPAYQKGALEGACGRVAICMMDRPGLVKKERQRGLCAPGDNGRGPYPRPSHGARSRLSGGSARQAITAAGRTRDLRTVLDLGFRAALRARR